MAEEFFKVWSKHILGNKEDFKIGIAQLEAEIRADEREKVLDEFKEKMCNLNQLNCFIDYFADEIDLEELMYYASEEIAEQLNEK